MSLARLWQWQGKHRQAHTTLSAIYGWFTEGFDTKDLQEAKGYSMPCGSERLWLAAVRGVRPLFTT